MTKSENQLFHSYRIRLRYITHKGGLQFIQDLNILFAEDTYEIYYFFFHQRLLKVFTYVYSSIFYDIII